MNNFKIFFKLDSLISSVNGVDFEKEKICRILISNYESGNITFRYEKEVNGLFYLYYDLKRNERIIPVELIIYKKDKYLKKLKTLKKKKINNNILKKIFAVLGLSSLMILLIPNFNGNKADNYKGLDVSIENLDDLFNTYLEENDDYYNIIDDLKNDNWVNYNGIVYESVIEEVKRFGIEESLDKELENIISNEVKHSSDFSMFYDEKKDNLKKDLLFLKVKINSLCLKSDKTKNYQQLTDDEYKILINQLYDYIEVLKRKYPNVDIENLMCNLFNISFFKNVDEFNDEENITYAVFYPWHIVWNVPLDSKDIFEKYKKINYHEFSHLNHSYCPCECDKNVLISGNSVILSNKILFGTKEFGLQPYYFKFMLEFLSEKQASDMYGENTSVYLEEGEVIDNIEFALSINPKYRLGTLMDSNIYRNPLLLYKSFPYIYDWKVELTDYLTMLECYDYCFGNDLDSYLEFYSIEDELTIADNQATSVSTSFSYYSRLKHIEIFYKNLFFLNESYDVDMLEYSLFLVRLFEELMLKQEKNSNYENPYLETTLLEGREMFIEYLKEKYYLYSYEEILNIYYGMNIESFNNFPTNIEEEKKDFIIRFVENINIDIHDKASTLIK